MESTIKDSERKLILGIIVFIAIVRMGLYIIGI